MVKPTSTGPDTPRGTSVVGEVAEFQGLYGAYHVSETLLQKVWMRGEFDLSRARLTSGEAVRILRPGTWNRLSGPDFRGARLQVGDRLLTGDVEVHFRAEAWFQHGHDTDPAYDEVIVHVVLFPPAPGAACARTRSGREIPVLVLVDLLWHDLEEYASDEAVAALRGRDPLPLIEELLTLPLAEREAKMREAAERRWRGKVYFSGRRIARVGWDQACHLTTLEVLGYRANRVAMMRVGEHFPWPVWQKEFPPVDELTAVAAEWWSLRGVRPANQPRLRLAQYRAWTQRVPDWPVRLRNLASPGVPAGAAELSATALRKRTDLPRWRAVLQQELCSGGFSGTRFDTWVCNLVLPFRASLGGAEGESQFWQIWYPGDAPESHLRALRHLAVPGSAAARTNGHLQALLGLQLARVDPSDAGTGPNPPPDPAIDGGQD